MINSCTNMINSCTNMILVKVLLQNIISINKKSFRYYILINFYFESLTSLLFLKIIDKSTCFTCIYWEFKRHSLITTNSLSISFSMMRFWKSLLLAYKLVSSTTIRIFSDVYRRLSFSATLHLLSRVNIFNDNEIYIL